MVEELEKNVNISAPNLAQYMRFTREQLGMDRLAYSKHLKWSPGIVKQIENGAGLSMKRARKLYNNGYPPKILFS